MQTALPPSRDAYAVFARATSAISTAQYPARIDYTIVVSGRDGSVLRVNHYPASYRPGANEIDVSAEGDCQCESDLGGSWSINVGAPERSPHLLGVPHLTPTYMFGLESPTVIEHSSGAGQQDYSVTLVDTPFISGTRTYHLKLTPLADPKKYRARELWVGSDDYLPRKAVIAGNFTTAPFTDVPWTIDFSILNGAPFIMRETASELFLPHRQVVKDATVAFEDVSARGAGTIFGHPLVAAPLTGAVLVEPSVELDK